MQTGSGTLFAGQDNFCFLEVQGNCRHKSFRNAGNIRGPWGCQVLPKVIKHQLLATIGHHKTYSGTSSELRTKCTRTRPHCYTDPVNLNTENCICSLREQSSRAQEFITRRTVIFSAVCLHSGSQQCRCFWVFLGNWTWNPIHERSTPEWGATWCNSHKLQLLDTIFCSNPLLFCTS